MFLFFFYTEYCSGTAHLTDNISEIPHENGLCICPSIYQAHAWDWPKSSLLSACMTMMAASPTATVWMLRVHKENMHVDSGGSVGTVWECDRVKGQ